MQLLLHLCNLRGPAAARGLRPLMEASGRWRKEDLTSCPELQPSTSNYVSVSLNHHNQWHQQVIILPQLLFNNGCFYKFSCWFMLLYTTQNECGRKCLMCCISSSCWDATEISALHDWQTDDWFQYSFYIQNRLCVAAYPSVMPGKCHRLWGFPHKDFRKDCIIFHPISSGV